MDRLPDYQWVKLMRTKYYLLSYCETGFVNEPIYQAAFF